MARGATHAMRRTWFFSEGTFGFHSNPMPGETPGLAPATADSGPSRIDVDRGATRLCACLLECGGVGAGRSAGSRAHTAILPLLEPT